MTNGRLCTKTSLRHFPECVVQLFFSHFEPKTLHNAKYWAPMSLASEVADPPNTRRKFPTALRKLLTLAHQNRTIAIASDFRVGGAKSPEIPQKKGLLDSEIAARNRKSLATFHRTLKSQCSILSEIAAISGVRDEHRNHKSQKSPRFRCAKLLN